MGVAAGDQKLETHCSFLLRRNAGLVLVCGFMVRGVIVHACVCVYVCMWVYLCTFVYVGAVMHAYQTRLWSGI